MLYIFDVDKTLVGPLDRFAKTLDEQQPLPGVVEKFAELRAQGHTLTAATQKGGVAWGIMTIAEADAFTEDALAKIGGVDAWRTCYNDPGAARRFPDSALSHDHPWRKPNPGMLISLMDEWGFLPNQTIFVGDMETDRQAARRLRLDPDVLTRLVQSDKIRLRAVRTCDGQIMLDQEDVERMAKAMTLRDKIWERVKQYDNETIGVREARDLYHIPDQTIYRCIEKGYIRADKPIKGGRGIKRLLNKADVAYVAELVKHGGGRGHRLFTEDTIPPHAMN